MYTPELDEWLLSEGGLDPVGLLAADPSADAEPGDVGVGDAGVGLQDADAPLSAAPGATGGEAPLPEADPEWFDGSWEEEGGAEEPPFPGDEVQTRTIAELYVSQGLVERGVQVYRELAEANPLDEGLAARLAELESGLPGAHPAPPSGDAGTGILDAPEPFPGDDDASLEEAASVFLEPPAGLEVDSPFTWTGAVEPDSDEGAISDVPVADYLTSILEWTPPADVEEAREPSSFEGPLPVEEAGTPDAGPAPVDEVDLSPSPGLEGLPVPTPGWFEAGEPVSGEPDAGSPLPPPGTPGNPVPVQALGPAGEVPRWVPVASLAPDGAIPTWVDIRSLAPETGGEPENDGGAGGGSEPPPPVSSSDADFRAWLEQLRL